MSTILLIIIIALGLMIVELFVPGGILALIALVLFFIASVIAYFEYDLTVAVFLFGIAVLLSCCVLMFEIHILQRGPIAKMITHTGQHTAKAVTTGAENVDLVGCEGVAITKLFPTGKVRVNGKIYEATTKDELLENGESIRVVRVDAFQIIVQKLDNR